MNIPMSRFGRCLTMAVLVSVAARAGALSPGDLSFVGFNADGTDGFAIVALTDIPPGTQVYFRDDEWSGTAFVNNNEGSLLWDAGGAPISAGTVVAFDAISNTNLYAASIGALTGEGINLGASDEGLFAYEGGDVDTPTAFLAAFANDNEVEDTFTNLTGTALVVGDTAQALGGDDDVMEYAGPRTGLDAPGYRALLATKDYWISQDGTGDQSQDGIEPDVPFALTPFYVNSEVSNAKWHQPPDTTPDGVDVGFASMAPLAVDMTIADDFLCTQTGPITGVTVYASWYADNVDPAASFDVCIWTDQPATEESHSRPADMLCCYTFNPGDYPADIHATVLPGEWFYNPVLEFASPEADQAVWRYDFMFPRDQLDTCVVTQQAGNIYWISVMYRPVEQPNTNFFWGWKSSPTHFNDDAVFMASGNFVIPWTELTYPGGHPLVGQSMDLAFAVYTQPEDEPPARDFGDAPSPYPVLLANTGAWHLLAGPWLGDSGNGPDAEPDGQPDPNALGDDLDGNDDELGVFFPPLIQGLSTNIEVRVSGGGGMVQLWIDTNGDGAWAHPAEQVYAAALADGTHDPTITLPAAPFEGSTFARARISVSGGLPPTGGHTDGEVEDHNVFINDGMPEFCNLQFPWIVGTAAGVPTTDIYGQVYIVDQTPKAGPTPGLVAQLGYGAPGTDAATHGSWVWTPAVFNTDTGPGNNNDEFVAQLTVPAPGVYDMAYRYSWYGQPACYGDTNDFNGGYSPADNGKLFVDPAPPAECAKWRQPPDCELGLNIRSRVDFDDALGSLVADDFVSDGRPITAIRWWGSYIGYEQNPELFDPPPGMRPTHFELSWYQDVPAGVDAPWSHPGALITNVHVELLPYGASADAAGEVTERFYCTTPLTWIEPPQGGEFEHEYEYYAELEVPWLEKATNVYWLAIRARQVEPDILSTTADSGGPYSWGWKTTSPQFNWNDDAVDWIEGGEPPWMELLYPPGVAPWDGMTNHPYEGLSVNLAFEILTDVCPARCLKWRQEPDMQEGTDMASWRWHAEEPMPGMAHRADDFVSDGRPITDIHWWGSYIGWRSEITNAAPEIRPVRPPPPPFHPLGFDVSWHWHDPIGCAPGALITNLFVPMHKVHEVYYGPVDQFWVPEQPFVEHEYQYYVDLLDPEVSGEPWYEEAGTQYWLNIRAVFPDAFFPDPGFHQGWGWKITPAITNCPSAVRVFPDPIWTHDVLPPPHPRPGLFDLAFELTTTNMPPADSPWYEDVAITNIARHGPGDVWLTSVGNCGCGKQILQMSTNLLLPGGGFGNLWTNRFPRDINHWVVTPVHTQAYYRILKSD